ncbi:MAG TPA: phosphoglycerate mutase family protein [Actinomycetes bacterium]
MIYLVRHGHAGDKRAWAGDDALRPLSATGHREAAGLLVQLRTELVARILSSPTLRCQQTVWPLAAQRRLRVDLDPGLDVDAAAEAATALLLAPALGDAVLCTHGELIGELLGRLRDAGAPIPADATWPKGSTWRLRPSGGRIAEASYLPPLRHAG